MFIGARRERDAAVSTPSLLLLKQKHQVVSEKLLSSEIGIRMMMLTKGLLQLPGSDMGKKALAWGCPWGSLLQPPAATAGRGCSSPMD